MTLDRLRHAWNLWISHFGIIAALTLTIWIPGSILLSYLHFWTFAELDELTKFAQELRINNALEVALGPIYIGGILHVLNRSAQGKQPLSYSEAIAAGARRSFKLVCTRIVTNLIVAVGCVLFIVPGIILGLHYAFVDAVVVLEGREGGAARNKSTALSKGYRWQILGALIMGSLFFLGAVLAVALVLAIPDSLLGKDETVVTYFLNSVFGSLLFTFYPVLLFSFYWQSKQASLDEGVAEQPAE